MTGFRKVAAARGWAWLRQGGALLGAAPRLWLAMAAVYLALAMVLETIPFIGRLILVLLTPLVLLGALPVAAGRAPDPAGRAPALLALAARRLFAGLRDHDRLLAVAVVSTMILGGLVVTQILAQLLKANPGALVSTVASGVSSSVWLTALFGVAIVMLLELLLVMAVLYAVPLILFRNEHPLPAIGASFRAAGANFGAFAIFAGAFVLAGIAARVLFHGLPFPLDYLAVLAVGLVALPLFVAGLYASAQELFPETPH